MLYVPEGEGRAQEASRVIVTTLYGRVEVGAHHYGLHHNTSI